MKSMTLNQILQVINKMEAYKMLEGSEFPF